MIAHRETADAGPDCLDHAGAFVATAERQVTNGDVTGREVIVRMAQTGRAHPHKHLVVTRFVSSMSQTSHSGGNLPKQRCSCSHVPRLPPRRPQCACRHQ